MCKPYVLNRIIDNQYEMYKNKLLYTALKNAKPITRTNWVENELPIINKKSLLEIKDRTRIKGFINIAQENLKFFNRLNKSKSSYNIRTYNKDYEKNKKYSDNIRKCRKISLPKVNKKYYFHNNSGYIFPMINYGMNNYK